MLFRKQTGVVMAAVILFSAWMEAQEDESRIPLRGDLWVQMSGEEIAWPAEGEALELALNSEGLVTPPALATSIG